MKAFVVKTAHGFYAEDSPTQIYFMELAIHARRAFAEEYNDGELGGIIVKREKSLEMYAATGAIPFWRLAYMGWWTECDHCGEVVSEDALNDRELDPTDIVGTFHSRVFCSPTCHDLWKAERAEKKNVEGQALYDLENYLFKYFPGVTVTRTQAYSSFIKDKCVLQHSHVFFTFPDQNCGECRLTDKHVVTVPRGALTMFGIWRETLDVDRPE